MSAYLGNHSLNNSSSSRRFRPILPKLPNSTLNVAGHPPEKAAPYSALSTKPPPSNFYLSPSLFNTPYSFAFTHVAKLLEDAFMSDSRLQTQLQNVCLERMNSGQTYPIEQASHSVLEALFREASDVKKELAKNEGHAQGGNKRKAESFAVEASVAKLQARMEWLQTLVSALFSERKQNLQQTTQQMLAASAISQADQEHMQNDFDDLNVDIFRMYQLFKVPLRSLLGLSNDEGNWDLIFNALTKKLGGVLKNMALERAKPAPSEELIEAMKIYAGVLYEAFFVFYQEEKLLRFYIENNLPFKENWMEISREFIRIKKDIRDMVSQERGADQKDIKYINLHISMLNENFFKIYEAFSKILQPVHDVKFISENWNNVNSMFVKMWEKLELVRKYKRHKEMPNRRLLSNVESHFSLIGKSFFLGYQQRNSIISSKTDICQGNVA